MISDISKYNNPSFSINTLTDVTVQRLLNSKHTYSYLNFASGLYYNYYQNDSITYTFSGARFTSPYFNSFDTAFIYNLFNDSLDFINVNEYNDLNNLTCYVSYKMDGLLSPYVRRVKYINNNSTIKTDSVHNFYIPFSSAFLHIVTHNNELRQVVQMLRIEMNLIHMENTILIV